MPKENHEAKNKRQQILDAAYVVFSRKGFHRATVDEIIALADTGKGTVYNYFASKEQLFYTLIKERSQPFHERLDGVLLSDRAILDKIYAVTKEFLHFYAANADLWRVLMHEMRAFGETGYSAFDERQQEKYRKSFESTLNVLERIIEDGVKEKVLLECNPKQAAYGLFSAIIAIVFQHLVGEDPDKAAEKIAHTFLFGIAAKE